MITLSPLRHPRRHLAAAAAALAVAVPLLAATPAVAADPTEGACAPGQGVTVVVDGTTVGGTVETRCAPGDPADGVQALQAAGFETVTDASSGFGLQVCFIGTVGNPCSVFDGNYWVYSTAVGPDWEISGAGASSVDPVPGDVQGWRWGSPVLDPDTFEVIDPAPGQPTVAPPSPGPVRTGGTGEPDPAASATAAAYLATQVTDGAVAGFGGGPAYDITADTAFALLADGTQDVVLDAVLDRLEQDAALWAHGQQFAADGERADAVYAGQTAKLGLLVLLAGGDPRAVGGLDLVADLQSTEVAGLYTDISAFGAVYNVFTQAFGLMLLSEAADVDPSAAATQVLLDAQCDDGGFPVALDQPTCASDPDATGIALQALVSLGEDDAAARAVAFLFSVQRPDGSFGSTTPGATGANVNTTGYAAMGLAAAGQDVSTTVTWLSSVLRPDGGLPVTVPPQQDSSDAFATAQALPALNAEGFVASARVVARPDDQVPTPTPTPTDPVVTPTPTPTATPTASPTTSAAAAGVRDSSTVGRRSGASGSLAATGFDALLPIALGGGFVLAGAVAVGATRRRGDHS